MNASILIVSSDDFPSPLTRHLEKLSFSCLYSRGVLKTSKILENEHVDGIVWLFKENESALALDLLKVFNLHIQIPIVFITENYKKLNFAENIRGLFANLDLNDDLGDIILTIETACGHSIVKEQEPVGKSSANEIEFKNIVSQIVEGVVSKNGIKTAHNQNLLGRVELWEAVDKSEKQILAGGFEKEEKRSFVPKLKLFQKKR
jgi:hypothetical protein